MSKVSTKNTSANSIPAARVNPDRAALESARQKLEAMPSNATQRLALAEACFRLAVQPETEIEAAIVLLRQALANDPFHPKFFFHLARMLHQNGEPLAAAVEYRRALRLAARSHRTFVHMALALQEIGADEKALAMRILMAVAEGNDEALSSLISSVDKVLGQHLDDKFDKTQTKPQNGFEKSGKKASRWKGIWKQLIIFQLADANNKKAEQNLEKERALAEATGETAEYALACLLFLLDSQAACRRVDAWISNLKLVADKDRPSLRLVKTVCELGGCDSPEEFVRVAVDKINAGELPAELVCALHYAWYGQSEKIDAISTAQLLHQYPVNIRSLQFFRELQTAVFDYHARRAYNRKRLDHAEILWQEALSIYPSSIKVAHNLALVATRLKIPSKYAEAWDRACETRYLLADSAGDVRMGVEDRIRLHRSFAQQGLSSHIKTIGSRKEIPDEELTAWMEDCEAFNMWLREWDLYYLNTRLRFRSPLHLLGLPRDCPDNGPETAAQVMLRQFRLCFRRRNLAGIQSFIQLVDDLTSASGNLVRDPIQRKRDQFFEIENEQARKLTMEALERGFLLLHTVQKACSSSSPQIWLSGLRASAHLLSMPWMFLEPVAKKIGYIQLDLNLMTVFTSHISALAYKVSQEGKRGLEDQAMEAVEDCLHALPNDADLAVTFCHMLLKSKHYHEVYYAALAALPTVDKMTNREKATLVADQLIIMMNNAVAEQLPKELMPPSSENLEACLVQVRRLLTEYPKAGQFRLMAVKWLIQAAVQDPKWLKAAAELLEEGLDHLLSDKLVQEAQELLQQVGSGSETIKQVVKNRKLLESATNKAQKAMLIWQQEQTPANKRKVDEMLASAIDDAVEAEQSALAANLKSAAEHAHATIMKLRELRDGIK